MKRLALISSLMLAACSPHIADQTPEITLTRLAHAPRDFPAVQAFADAAVRDKRVPAISIAVAVGDEPPTYISAGQITLAPASPQADLNTLWRIYSMTKPVTAIAAMILVDDGKLHLDQPISDLLPEFSSSRVLIDPAKSLDTRPATRPITVRDLMTHTSGLNYGIMGEGPVIDALKRAGVVPFALNRDAEAGMRPLRPTSLQEFARRAAETGLVADPGTRFSYSMGLDVLAAVVEEASGMPFEIFLQQRLFDPLQMQSTFWYVPEADTGRFASNVAPGAIGAMFAKDGAASNKAPFVAFDPAATSVFLDPPSFPYGGAGLISTARDYDRFLHMLLNDGSLEGVRVLSPATARLAMSNLLPSGVSLKDFGPIPPGEETGMGAGGFVTVLEADAFGRRRGTYGWDGAAGSRAWVDPVRKVRATMMINVFGAMNVGADFDKAVAADIAAANDR